MLLELFSLLITLFIVGSVCTICSSSGKQNESVGYKINNDSYIQNMSNKRSYKGNTLPKTSVCEECGARIAYGWTICDDCFSKDPNNIHKKGVCEECGAITHYGCTICFDCLSKDFNNIHKKGVCEGKVSDSTKTRDDICIDAYGNMNLEDIKVGKIDGICDVCGGSLHGEHGTRCDICIDAYGNTDIKNIK